jgi:sensor histidine kinase YesM
LTCETQYNPLRYQRINCFFHPNRYPIREILFLYLIIFLTNTPLVVRNNKKITRNDYLVLFLLIAPFSIILNYVQFRNSYFTDANDFAGITLLGFLIWTISWRVHLLALHLLRQRMTGYNKTVIRTLFTMAIFIPLTAATISFTFWLYTRFQLFGYQYNASDLYSALLSGVIFNCTCNSFHEGTYLFENWKQSLLESQQFKNAHLQSQLDALKSQVNPHFLFNTLNSLSSLISENPEKAEKFADEMSKVYRYLLDTNKEELVTLQTELKFIQSFYHLLKIRYNTGIHLELIIAGEFNNYLLPPLTLQLLIENAIKHNITLKEQPLNIEIIATDERRVIVKNNLQRKTTKQPSHKIGLDNIAIKYQLMKQGDITVKEEDGHFMVTVPLIHPSFEQKGPRRSIQP